MAQNHNIDQNMSEDAIQAQCFQWLWNSYPKTRYLCFSIPNGGLRTRVEAMRLVSTGAVAGMPDMVGLATGATYQGHHYHHLYVEMKKPGGRLSDEQVRSHVALRAAGNLVVVCYGLDEFKEVLLAYLAGSDILS